MSLSPDALRIDAQTRLLVVAPHPDDETIATGELIQRVRAVGGDVRVLLLTDGDDNPWPQRWLERRLRIDAADRCRWGQRRRVEVVQALQMLGLGPPALHMLGWPDMGITELLRTQCGAMLSPLLAQLADYQPSLIALPALSDRHPDHGSAHVLLRLALAHSGQSPPLLGYLVHGRADPAARSIEAVAAPPLHATKLAALEAHRSQTALSGARLRRLADRPERYAIAAAWPDEAGRILPWQPPVLWQRWLQLLVVDGNQVRSWHWRRAPLQRDANGRYRLQCELDRSTPCFARLFLEMPSPWIFDRWGWCEV